MSCSRPSARPTTGTRGSSRSGRTRAGGASWSRGCRSAPRTPSSTSPAGRARSRSSSSAAPAARSWASTRARRCWPRRGGGGRQRAGRLVEGSAAELPFEDASFDGLTAAYLLRYLDDLPAGLAELARVLRPGATASLLDFGVPPAPLTREAWNFWVDAGLPLAGRAISPGWHEVGRFLGASIRRFHAEWPLESLLGAFREPGSRARTRGA